jgi:peptide deformylase
MAPKLEVVLFPDPRLMKKTAPVGAITPAIRERVREMFRVMYDDRGVGLAAPQVGWSVRLFVMNPTGDPKRPEDEVVLVNPRMVARKGRVRGEEGCLSFPEIHIEVDRGREVAIEWTDLDGAPHSEKWLDWKARIFQHELDHLENVLLWHRMTEGDRITFAAELDELRQKYRRKHPPEDEPDDEHDADAA